MKKILIISAVFPPEPVVSAQISYALAAELSKSNIVTVLCPQPTRPLGFNFEIITTRHPFHKVVLDSYTCAESRLLGRVRESYSFGKACRQYIETNYQNIEVIYMNAWPLLGQIFIVRAATKYKIKIISHVQDIYPESFTLKMPFFLKGLIQKILLPFDKYVLSNSTHVIAISNNMKRYLVETRKLKEGDISVIANWQNETDFIDFKIDEDHKSISDNFIFMYLGNIGPVAGIEFLIECFAGAKLESAKLVVAGSGSTKKQCQNISLNYLDSKIEFWDVPDGQVPKIQSIADVMLLPVKKGAALSSIPSKLPAYMFSKKPIMACVDAGSDTAETIIQAGCGWVIEPENKVQLIKLFKIVFSETEESKVEKGENGFAFAMQRFSKRANLKKIINLIIGSF